MTDTTGTIDPAKATIDEIPSGLPPTDADPATPRRRRGVPFGGVRRTVGGIGAVGVKELRGRMRGRRAFVILSAYLVLLAGFAWMIELIMERTYSNGAGANATFATAAIGQGIFAGLLMLETLLVAFLAPMATAGSISLEREKQTLEMLAATPITSLAIVLGKLLSALIYVWLLIAASIPLTAVVFVFGGVAPDDLIHGYLVLIVTALGFGSFGLLCSSLVKRTQAATAITIFGVLAISLGSLFVIFFWQELDRTNVTVSDGVLQGVGGPVQAVGAPAQGPARGPLAWIDPFLAQADVAPADALCATDSSLRYYCRFRSVFLLDQNGVVFLDNTIRGGVVGKGIPFPNVAPAPGFVVNGGAVGVAPDIAPDIGPIQADVVPFDPAGDPLWPKTVIAWLVLSAVFLVLSVQFVSPTRRWRLRGGRRNLENSV
jgi:ABC-type transport system involved in multi-copper enzyme maturation permease subunit